MEEKPARSRPRPSCRVSDLYCLLPRRVLWDGGGGSHTRAGTHEGAVPVRSCVTPDLRSILSDAGGKTSHTCGTPMHVGACFAGVFSDLGRKRPEAQLDTCVYTRGRLRGSPAEHMGTRARELTAHSPTPGASAVREGEWQRRTLSHAPPTPALTPGSPSLGVLFCISCIYNCTSFLFCLFR